MQAKGPTLRTIFSARRLMHATFALGLVFGFAQTGLAQANPLNIFKNYFVTGDYVVAGVGLRGLGDASGFATGTISVPDKVQAAATGVPSPGVPPGADIVAAFLYWETVESTAQLPPHPGQKGFFNGYPIIGQTPGNPNAPTSWSSGGCSGSSQGAKTIVAYRADVRPFLPVDANGNIQTPNAVTPGNYTVSLADSGSNGGGTPFTLGATLVIIYKVLSSSMFPLNSIVLYDGAFAPSNQTANSEMTQTIQGFYQPDGSHKAKITHIVGDGQSNKSEQVNFQTQPLLNLYSAFPTVAFPGIYNGSWDNPTWDVTGKVNGGASGFDTSVVTSVIPGSGNTGSGCVDWGAVIFSTTVQSTNGDGLLDTWKAAKPPGYTDVISISNQFVSLPGANPSGQDIFVEIDYLTLRDPITGSVLHSHLPKQLALDKVGDAFAKQNIHVHFDVGSTNYKGNCSTTSPFACPDPYIIQGGTGGNEIPEGAVVCTDSTTLCQFPNQAAVGWKEGVLFVKNNATVPGTNVPLGNFQFGRKDSYHYVLFGHALGTPRSFWTTFGATEKSTSVAKLDSIVVSTVNSVTTTTVKIESPPGLFKPGDCPNLAIPACSDSNVDRVTVAGAMGRPALNGTYHFTNLSSSIDANNVTATTFNITTTGVADGTYDYGHEARLAVEYGGPTSSSGHSDFRGGGDSAVMFGLWPADDPPGCQADPSVSLNSGQTYCVDQVGTITAEAGTLLHEMGHTLTLTHGGQFFPSGLVNIGPPPGQQLGQEVNNPPFSAPTYGLNCNPGFLSSMNYLFQIRGFPDLSADGSHPIDYSGQTLPDLSEISLNETLGVGSDMFTNLPAAHFTRWYAPPNALDTQVGRFATHHCDGTLIGANEPPAVRVDGSTFSAPIDWNNNLIVDAIEPIAWQDVNFNGSTLGSPDPAFQGFNDWVNVDLRQVGSRASAFGLSGGGTGFDLPGGGSQFDLPGGGTGFDLPGGGSQFDLPGGGSPGEANSGGATLDIPGGGTGFDLPGGGSQFDLPGGGTEQDTDAACSAADPPVRLTAVLGSKSVVLNWTAPGGPCQVRQYDIWRATSPSTTFTDIQTLGRIKNGNKTTAPTTTFTDTKVKNGVTYEYFVTDNDVQGARSGASNLVTITVKF